MRLVGSALHCCTAILAAASATTALPAMASEQPDESRARGVQPAADADGAPTDKQTAPERTRRPGAPGLGDANSGLAADAGGKPHRDPAKFARFDDLREPMLTTRFPSLMDTVTGDAGGWRSWLADRNIGAEFQIATNAAFNLGSPGGPHDPQVYNGQRPTLQVHAVNAYLVAGLNALGLDNTKIIVAGGYLITSFDPNGPNTATFKELSVYQSFANKTVEIKAGFLENYVEYAGLFAGGNVTLSTGLASLVPIEAGLSAEPGPTPAVNVQINLRRGVYAKFGVQRSTNPVGNAEEVRNHGIGLDWSQHNARALYIGEVGLRRQASPDQRTLWLRAGYIHNTSPYNRFDGGTSQNDAVYALADYQLTRPDSQLFFRGLYVGASAEAATDSVNVFSRSAEVRAYYVGPFKSRPTDAVNLTLTYNRYSDTLHRSYLPAGIDTRRNYFGGSLGYVVQVSPGVHVTPAIQYIVNPIFLPQYHNAVIGALSVYIGL